MELCPSYREPAFLGGGDLCYATREVEVDACCERNLAGWVEAFSSADRRTRADWIWREMGFVVRDVIVNETILIPALEQAECSCS